MIDFKDTIVYSNFTRKSNKSYANLNSRANIINKKRWNTIFMLPTIGYLYIKKIYLSIKTKQLC